MAKKTEPTANPTEPVITSFSLVQRNEGWSVATIKTQGEKVLSTEYSTPDMKSIAQYSFKIAVVNALWNQ